MEEHRQFQEFLVDRYLAAYRHAQRLEAGSKWLWAATLVLFALHLVQTVVQATMVQRFSTGDPSPEAGFFLALLNQSFGVLLLGAAASILVGALAWLVRLSADQAAKASGVLTEEQLGRLMTEGERTR